MSDMKKVFVTLVDADGVEHRVAGYGYVDGRSFQSENDSNISNEIGNWWYAEFGGALKVEPAPEPLPTGLGAVVYLHRDYSTDLTLINCGPNQWRTSTGSSAMWDSDDILNDGGPYEVLSEGIEVNL